MECSLCTGTPRVKFSIRDYLKHLQLFHAHQPTFKITCGIGGCPRSYTNMKTYSNHVYGVHNLSSDPASPSEAPAQCGSSDICNDDLADPETCGAEDENSTIDYNTTENNECIARQPSDNPLQRSSALLLLGLKEKYKLPQSTVQGIVNGMTSLIQQQMDTLKSQVIKTVFLYNSVYNLCIFFIGI